MTNTLAGKVAIITGAGAGIGRATALRMAAEGARVVVADRDAEGCDETVRMIRDDGGEAIAIATDVTSEEQIKAMVSGTVEQYGRLDIAFNNAGIEGNPAPTAEYDVQTWNQVIQVNLTGVFLCMKYQLPEMQKNGSGSIINCSSIAGKIGFEASSAYVASKHGVIGLTKTAALEYAPEGIRVNAICPGVIDTAMVDRAIEKRTDVDMREMLTAMAPVGRMGTSDEIAEAVLYLASDNARFTTGTALVVDGGYLAR